MIDFCQMLYDDINECIDELNEYFSINQIIVKYKLCLFMQHIVR